MFCPLGSTSVTLIGGIFNELDKQQRANVFGLLVNAGAKPILASPDILDIHGREAMGFTEDGMNIYVILRMLGRSDDNKTQTFQFPAKGHVYDIRAGKYLGETDTVTAAVPYADAAVFGHYPYKVEGISINAPKNVKAGRDLDAQVAVVPSAGKAGKHVLHIEVLNPEGEGRFNMKRNMTAPDGKLNFKFRMAFNDRKGLWTLKVTDAMTQTTATRQFLLE